MIQNIATKAMTNPIVLQAIEAAVVTTVVYLCSNYMESYLDKKARKQAEQIMKIYKGRNNVSRI